MPASGKPTLSWYLTHLFSVSVHCTNYHCQHGFDLDLHALVDRYGPNTPIENLRFRCSRCGHTGRQFAVRSLGTGVPKNNSNG